jgi:membrane fusion protein (multidrug efflux system)
VLGADNVAELRKVTLGQAQGSEWLVEGGLKQGESIIVDGVQKVQPGAKVAPEAWKPAEAAASSSQQPVKTSE